MPTTVDRLEPAGLAATSARPSSVRYVLAALLVLAGVIGAFVWLGLASAAVNKHADAYQRTAVPGSLSLRVGHPGTYYVYVEGTSGTLGDLGLTVADPLGEAVAVTAMSSGSSYDHHGMFGHAVGRFLARRPGEYHVTAAGHLDPYGDFAVGDNAADRMTFHTWGVGVLLVLTIGSGSTLAVVTAISRRRRRQHAAQPDR